MFRKHRPDVGEGLLGLPEPRTGQANFGFIGHLSAHGESRTLDVELRSGSSLWRSSLPAFSDGPLWDNDFAGLALDPSELTPRRMFPLAEILRLTPRPPAPLRSVTYEHKTVPSHATINVVVPLYGHFDFLPNLLLNAKVHPYPNVAITVVCDDPAIQEELTGWTIDRNESFFRSPIRLITHSTNAGFSAACNTGWASTPAAYHMILNSDILIKNFGRDLHQLLRTLELGFSAVGPVLTYPDGSIQHAGMRMGPSLEFPGFSLPTHPGKGKRRLPLPDTVVEVPLLSGAALLVREQDLKAAGGVPYVFGRGDFEDVVLSDSLRRRAPLGIDPMVRWTHVEGASFDRQGVGGVPLTLAKSLLVSAGSFAAP